jgi:hypothetical protein
MTVTSLMYKINADSSSLSREFRSAERDVQRFSKRAESNVAKVGKAFGALGSMVAAAMVAAVKETISFGTELSLMSDRTGLAVEELGRLSFAAEQSGLSASDLEKGIARMNQSLVQAAQGSGRAAQAAERYGIALRDASGEMRGQNDIFLDIADAVKGAANAYEEAEIAASFFGTQGAQKLLPLLKEGRDGIEEMGDQAERLGIVLDTETAQASRALGDQLNILKRRSQGLALQFGSQVVPALNAYLESVNKSREGSDKLGERSNWVAKSFGFVLKTVEGVRVSFVILGETFGMLGALAFKSVELIVKNLRILGVRVGSFITSLVNKDFAAARRAFAGAGEEMGRQSRTTGAEIAAIWSGYSDTITDEVTESGNRMLAIDAATNKTLEDQAVETTGRVGGSFRDMGEQVERVVVRMNSITKRLLEDSLTNVQRFERDMEALREDLGNDLISEEQFDLLRQRLEEMHDPFGEFADRAEAEAARVEAALRMEGLAEAAERVRAEINGVDLRLQAHLESLEELRDEGLISWEEYAIAVEKAKGAIDELDDVAEESIDLLRNVAETFASSFIDFVVDPFNANVEEMATNFIKQITRMVLETAAQRAILAAFGDGFASGGSVSAGGGGSILGMATGGFVSGPGTATSDSIPALLSDGEYVLNARTVQRIGVGTLDAVNFSGAQGFSTGGLVGGGGGSSAPSVSVHMHGSQEEAALAALQSSAGRAMVIDIIGQNRRQVKRLLQ